MSYDSNQVCVDNPCPGLVAATCLSLDVANIDATDSPYTPDGSVVILGDTTAGNITLNLISPENCPNTKYIVKKTDGTLNKIIILPPAGETINGGATSEITKENEVVRYIRDDNPATPNWVITSYAPTDILTTKGQILTHNGVATLPLNVGTDGQVLTADSTAAEGVAWKTSPHILAFDIISFKVNVVSTVYTELGSMVWDQSEYGTFGLGRITIHAVIGDRDLDLEVLGNGLPLASITGISATGVYETLFTANPSADGIIVVRAKKVGIGGTNPMISAAQIIYPS